MLQETNEMNQFEDWKISLGSRNNLLYNDIPHVPMFVEDIPIYLSFEDHEKNGIKTIQTIGELKPKSETRAVLLSLTPGNSSEFPISLENLKFNDIYVKSKNNKYSAIWENHIVFKVYGTLKEENKNNVLEATHLVPIHDVKGTLIVMTLLILTARSEYRQYYRTKGQNHILQSQWEKMKEEKKRLVKVKKT